MPGDWEYVWVILFERWPKIKILIHLFVGEEGKGREDYICELWCREEDGKYVSYVSNYRRWRKNLIRLGHIYVWSKKILAEKRNASWGRRMVTKRWCIMTRMAALPWKLRWKEVPSMIMSVCGWAHGKCRSCVSNCWWKRSNERNWFWTHQFLVSN